MKFVWFTLSLSITLSLLIQSCNIDQYDSFGDIPSLNADKVSIATIQATETNDEYFFLIDGDKKLYPGDLSSITNYKWLAGQRVFVYFNLLGEKMDGYDYNAEIVYIQDILTKNIIPITEETADSIGDDKINITYAWFGGGHLNIEFQYLGTENASKPHMINLVYNENSYSDPEYITLEFRHNAYEDSPYKLLSGIASFKMPSSSESSHLKGVKLRVNTIYDDVKYRTVNFNEVESRIFNGEQITIR